MELSYLLTHSGLTHPEVYLNKNPKLQQYADIY